MTDRYILHYAPDNASQPVMLALEEMGLPYETRLVDRARAAQRDPAYLSLNPNGLIPVMETPDGPIFETGAILLWLADRHGVLAPAPDSPRRAGFLKWFFFASNTLHADLVALFHIERYGPPESLDAIYDMSTRRIGSHWARIEAAAAAGSPALCEDTPSVLDFYLASLARWSDLYPSDRSRDWFDLSALPSLQDAFARIETRDSLKRLARIEGLGAHPFTAPKPATPAYGSAT